MGSESYLLVLVIVLIVRAQLIEGFGTWDNLIQNQTIPVGIIYSTTLCFSLLICEAGVMAIFHKDFMETEGDNACKVFRILPGTQQALNEH